MHRLAALLLVMVSMQAGAVMDCSRARSNAEKMLCSNPRLMRAEEELAYAYREAIRRGIDPKELLESQRAWVSGVRDACNDVDCMLRAYQDRIADLDNR
jgi:uncharacterized protein